MDFFDDDDDDNVAVSAKRPTREGEEEEVDALDAFMMGVESELKEEPKGESKRSEVLMEEEEEDHMEGFLAYREENASALPEQDVVDEDGVQIDLNTLDLPPLDHSKIVYEPFKKNVFAPVVGQTLVDKESADAFRKQHDIRVRVDEGIQVPPVSPTIVGEKTMLFRISFFFFLLPFSGLGLNRTFTTLLQKQFSAPTAIQSQTVTAALCGNDIIGIAKVCVFFVLSICLSFWTRLDLEKLERSCGR
jgi:hypothetical protein